MSFVREALLKIGDLGATAGWVIALENGEKYKPILDSLVGGTYARSVVEHLGEAMIIPFFADLFCAIPQIAAKKEDKMTWIRDELVISGGLYFAINTYREITQAFAYNRLFQIEQYVAGLAGLGIGALAVFALNKWAKK